MGPASDRAFRFGRSFAGIRHSVPEFFSAGKWFVHVVKSDNLSQIATEFGQVRSFRGRLMANRPLDATILHDEGSGQLQAVSDHGAEPKSEHRSFAQGPPKGVPTK